MDQFKGKELASNMPGPQANQPKINVCICVSLWGLWDYGTVGVWVCGSVGPNLEGRL